MFSYINNTNNTSFKANNKSNGFNVSYYSPSKYMKMVEVGDESMT